MCEKMCHAPTAVIFQNSNGYHTLHNFIRFTNANMSLQGYINGKAAELIELGKQTFKNKEACSDHCKEQYGHIENKKIKPNCKGRNGHTMKLMCTECDNLKIIAR